MPLLGNRFLTFNAVVRVNQIEVGRDRDEGNDERDDHAPEIVEAYRAAFEEGMPGGRMTWAMSWRALGDETEQYRTIRRLIRGYADRYGDDVTFIPGGYFANAYNTREQVNRDLHEGLVRVEKMMGAGYRPKSVIAGFLAAENQRFLAENEGIHVVQGNIWSQYAIDNQDGEGSLCYPYYSSREHFNKPAQGPADFIDIANLDGWTMDFLAARRPGGAGGFNSRLGVGPIETIGTYDRETALREMIETTAIHFDDGFKRNGFAWTTVAWEVCIVRQAGFRDDAPSRAWRDSRNLDGMIRWLLAIRSRWPDAKSVTLGEFGEAWRREHRDNSTIDYRFAQRGTGIGGSDADKEIRWFMNRDFRLALLRDLATDRENVIDWTPYSDPAKEPEGMPRNWSLWGRINQKGLRPQDAPVPFDRLPAADRETIVRRYPDLG